MIKSYRLYLELGLFSCVIALGLSANLAFSQTRGFKVLAKSGEVQASFDASFAIVVGIDEYKQKEIPKLHHAVKDAKSVAEMLLQSQGFPKEQVLELYDHDATKERILKAFDQIIHASRPNDRIFFYFAGHGITLTLPNVREKGFILPWNADVTQYSASCISTDQLNEWSEAIPAKHLYFVMDACYGGTIFTRGASLSPETEGYVKTISERTARQAITAGGRDQQVLDTGPGGHSVFTYYFVTGIRQGLADLNNDGVITAGELAAYIAPQVAATSKNAQTPEYGSIAGDQGGEFYFIREGFNYDAKDVVIPDRETKLFGDAASSSWELTLAATRHGSGPQMDAPDHFHVLSMHASELGTSLTLWNVRQGLERNSSDPLSFLNPSRIGFRVEDATVEGSVFEDIGREGPGYSWSKGADPTFTLREITLHGMFGWNIIEAGSWGLDLFVSGGWDWIVPDKHVNGFSNNSDPSTGGITYLPNGLPDTISSLSIFYLESHATNFELFTGLSGHMFVFQNLGVTCNVSVNPIHSSPAYSLGTVDQMSPISSNLPSSRYDLTVPSDNTLHISAGLTYRF